MSASLRFQFAGHLSRSISSLRGLDPERDVVLMAEVVDEATYVPHHKRKIAFLFSAMRHFAAELRADGIRVDYVQLDDSGNSGSFGVSCAARSSATGRTRLWLPSRESTGSSTTARPAGCAGVEVELRPDDRFLCSREEFARWADGRSPATSRF